jgi:competence protein ComEC
MLILALNRVEGEAASGNIGVLGMDAHPGSRLHLMGPTKPIISDALPGAWSRALSAKAAGVNTLVQTKRALVQPVQSPSPFAKARHSQLLDRLILGRRPKLPETTADLLTETGTRHLLAISGLHVGMVSLLGAWAFGALARLMALFWQGGGLRFLPALGACFCGFLYASTAGMPISAQRAISMLMLSWCCWFIYRPARVWTLYSLALAATVFLSPGQVRTLSFCLSFSAVAGVIVATSWVRPKLDKKPPWMRWLAYSFAASLGAQLGGLAITAWVFQEFPLTGPLANLVAVPLVGLLVLPAAFLSAAGLPFALGIADFGLDLLLAWLELMRGPVLHPAVGPVGAAGLVLALLLSKYPGPSLWVAALALGLKSQPTAGLRITHFAVGQGDSALVEREGVRVLVDGGPRQQAVLHALRRQGIHRLDEVLLTHPHQDHMAGLHSILEALDVGCLRIPSRPQKTEKDFKVLLQIAKRRKTALCKGTQAPLPGFRLFQAKGPDLSTNDASLVLEVSYRGTRALLSGDLEARGEGLLAESLRPVDWLKVPHHGSRGASSKALIEATLPRFALVSAGLGNRYGHPHKQTLARYKHATLLQTATAGSVVFQSMGTQQWVRCISPTRLVSPWSSVPP